MPCFTDSIAEVLDRYIGDEKLRTALYGQGVIGTWGGPYEPGTASIKLMQYQGDLEGQGPVWVMSRVAWECIRSTAWF